MAGWWRRWRHPGHTPAESGGATPWWSWTPAEALSRIDGSPDGLTADAAASRLLRSGAAVPHRRQAELRLLARQFTNPITLILIGATAVSAALGDLVDATLILLIVLASGVLGYWQERSASHAVADLLASVQSTVAVRRDGNEARVPAAEVVVGDVVLLATGDTVPGDCLLLDADELQVNEASLTGESYPVEKAPGSLPVETSLADRTNAVSMGTTVVRGRATGLVMATGPATAFGRIAAELERDPPRTRFEQGMADFSRMLFRVMLVLIAAILVVNVAFARPLLESVLFALALAVGITPQLLPAIVSASLSYGSRRMARAQVIVKRLNTIEDIGGMTALCTDKTGTLTEGTVTLAGALGPDGAASEPVLTAARLNAMLHTGFANPIDDAILAAAGPDLSGARRLAEAPYDFERKRLSVLVERDGERSIVTKGAVESVLAVCASVRFPGGPDRPIGDCVMALRDRFVALSHEGYRVLGVACREGVSASSLDVADERGMSFLGFACFLDPPRAGVEARLRDLAEAGVSLRLVTGDNRHAAAHLAATVGLDASRVLTGADVAAMSGETLAREARDVQVFAEIEPVQKEQLVRALQRAGNGVGFLGDGINDAPALHAADVGISVDTAVSVARDAASIVLLRKDLAVLLEGMRLGRQTFANTRKYVFITTSASFGNMASMAAATLFLPFLPLLPFQVLLINLLTDFPAMSIAADAVDSEALDRPVAWDIGFIRRFMLVFGAISSVFDLICFAVLRLGFGAGPELFRSGWFFESIGTELAVMLVLRTRRPFWRSRPGRGLVVSSAAVAAVTVALVLLPVGVVPGIEPLEPLPFAVIVAILVGYVAATEAAKRRYYRRDAVELRPAFRSATGAASLRGGSHAESG
jgi:Mg2+-importing ATPase